MSKLNEKADNPAVNPNTKYNAAKGILRFSDFQKLSKLNKGEVPLGVVARPVGTYGEETDQERENLKSMRNQLRPSELPNTVVDGEDPTETGHTLDVGDNDQLRRRKVAYRVDEKIDINYMPDLGQQLERGETDPDMANLVKKQKLRTIPEGPMQPSGTDKVGFDNSIARDVIAKHQSTLGKQSTVKQSTLLQKLRSRDGKSLGEESEIEEDVHTADYKVNPQTGRKYRSHHITFAASRHRSDPDSDDLGDDDSQKKRKPTKTEPAIIPGPEAKGYNPK